MPVRTAGAALPPWSACGRANLTRTVPRTKTGFHCASRIAERVPPCASPLLTKCRSGATWPTSASNVRAGQCEHPPSSQAKSNSPQRNCSITRRLNNRYRSTSNLHLLYTGSKSSNDPPYCNFGHLGIRWYCCRLLPCVLGQLRRVKFDGSVPVRQDHRSKFPTILRFDLCARTFSKAPVSQGILPRQ